MTDIITTADDFNRAMTLWFELTGIDPEAKSWRGWHEIDMRQINEELKLSMTYDPSLVTAYLLLDTYAAHYFKEKSFTVASFDSDPDAIFEYMDRVREFKRIVRQPSIVEESDRFIEATRKALVGHGVAAERIIKFLDDRGNLALIRRDALKSINRMRVDQFLSGDVDPEGVAPLYNPVVFGYWNMNSMVEHVCGMPSGMSLNLIRDPDELHSYFGIAIRNGGNLLMMTDVPEYAHPLGRMMSRRPDKQFDARAARNWFPYDLLNIKYTEDGDPFHDVYRESKEKGITPHQPKHFVLKEVGELALPEIVWLTLMFDLIRERYWNQPFEQRSLSYTSEMIRLDDQNVLLGAAARANLPVTGYQPLNLPKLTLADVRTDSEAMDAEALGKPYGTTEKYFGRNRWMEERYGDKVPEEVLNLLGPDTEGVLFISDKPVALQPYASSNAADKRVLAPVEGEVHRFKDGSQYRSSIYSPFEDLDRRGKNRFYALQQMPVTAFGTRTSIDADRKFLARHNFAKGIQREADREYEARVDEIKAWFKKRIFANLDHLLPWAHFKTLHMPMQRVGDDDAKYKQLFYGRADQDNKEDRSYGPGSSVWSSLTLHHKDDGERGEWTCFVTGARKIRWIMYFGPHNLTELCWMVGCTRDELPDVLQHWNKRDDHVGNHILSRIDPLEWALKNPWVREDFAVKIYLSQSGLAKLIKQYPVPTPPTGGEPAA